MAGFAAVGMGFYVVAPNLILSALSLLLLAACPLLMLLMMNVMQGMSSTGERISRLTQKLLRDVSKNNMFSRDEQLAQLREQLQGLQEQQSDIASQINVLEQAERQSTFDTVQSEQ